MKKTIWLIAGMCALLVLAACNKKEEAPAPGAETPAASALRSISQQFTWRLPWDFKILIRSLMNVIALVRKKAQPPATE